MPKRKICEDPMKHERSTRVPKGVVAMPSQLSKFLTSEYDVADTRIGWLCPRCHAFESKKMMTHQSMELDNEESSTDDEVMTEGSPVHDEKNDDNAVNLELDDMNEEEERNPLLDVVSYLIQMKMRNHHTLMNQLILNR